MVTIWRCWWHFEMPVLSDHVSVIKRMQLVSQKQSRRFGSLVEVGCCSHGIPIANSPGWQPKHSRSTPWQQPKIEQRDSPPLSGFSDLNFEIAFLPRYWSTSFRDSFAFKLICNSWSLAKYHKTFQRNTNFVAQVFLGSNPQLMPNKPFPDATE